MSTKLKPQTIEHKKGIGKFEYTKGASRSRKSKKDRNYNDQKDKKTIYKTLHWKLKIEQHENH